METIFNKFNGFLGFVGDLATNISETFTGTNSNRAFVLIVFYLVVALLILFLLKAVIKGIKGLFGEIFSPPKRKATGPIKADSPSTMISEASNQEAANKKIDSLSHIRAFNKDLYLNVLSLAYKKLNITEPSTDLPQQISYVPPQPLNLDNSDCKNISAEEEEKIRKDVAGKDLSELDLSLSFESGETTALNQSIDSMQKAVAAKRAELDEYIASESSATNEYNTAVDKYLSLKSECDDKKAALSVRYFNTMNSINLFANRISTLFEDIKSIEKEILSIPRVVEDFDTSCKEEASSSLKINQNKDELCTLKNSCEELSQKRIKAEEELLVLYEELEKALKEKALHDVYVVEVESRRAELAKREKERLEKIEAERLAKIEAERVAQEKAAREKERLEKERLERERIERAQKEAEEAERIAREIAAKEAARLERERIEKEKLEQEATREKEKEAPLSSDNPDVADVQGRIEQQSKLAYALNFENISPEMIEKLAQADRKRKADAEKAVKRSGASDSFTSEPNNTSAVEEAQEEQGENKEKDVSPSRDADTAPKTDYITELKRQWAAERAHKEAWAAEQARRKEEEQRRKKELERKLSETSSSEGNE